MASHRVSLGWQLVDRLSACRRGLASISAGYCTRDSVVENPYDDPEDSSLEHRRLHVAARYRGAQFDEGRLRTP